jgi:hypothetical protein
VQQVYFLLPVVEVDQVVTPGLQQLLLELPTVEPVEPVAFQVVAVEPVDLP